MFSLEQLRGFVAVAEELHFGRAAERLAMTQPPLSRQVMKLERAVGVRLLERDNRGVELTAAGAAFLEEARRLLRLAETAPDRARQIAAGATGTLRMGFTAASAYAVLPPVLRHLRRELPDVELDLEERVSREQVAALLGGEMDLGMGRPPFDPALASRLLAREALCVAVDEEHELAGLDRPVEAEDVRGLPVVMHDPVAARYFHELVVRSVDVDPRAVVHTVSQVLTMTLLVSAGMGLAFVPASVGRLGIEGVRLLPLRTSTPEPVELHLLWDRHSRNPALPRVLHALEDWHPLVDD
ncbi:LysR family transcriptional regulator [Marmoricola endophyticus]|uniref:LysR family transcriptional regulator n=1 Tax=Marmoricola endophyticus TaxID=2040280 RepID=A0A917F970_9ACTN|nr:LysR family transcriptional regulator [Marmoricola endophyticus]GGF54858.1 LysR family transcriptional regulator [Marmoricola endophyticus]